MTKPQPSPTIDPAALKATQEALNNAPSGDAPGVDKIRELLFGNQMQDYDQRFSVLEDRFQQKMRDMEAESARSLRNMESSIKKQLESIASQVRQEQELRADADKELGRRLREQMDTLEKHLGKVSDQLASLEREFTDRVGHESRLCETTSGGGTRILAQPSNGCSPSSATSRPIAICWPVCSSRLPDA